MDIKPAPTMPGQAEENWNTVNAYCIQCLTGYESKTADAIRLCCDGVDAYAVMQERHRSRAGRRTLERSVMLPGYVFVYAREALSFRRLLSVENVLSVRAQPRQETTSGLLRDLWLTGLARC